MNKNIFGVNKNCTIYLRVSSKSDPSTLFLVNRLVVCKLLIEENNENTDL